MAGQRPSQLDNEYLDVAVRAWAVRRHPAPDEDELETPSATWGPRLPSEFLVFDTETTADTAQRLLFGCWRYLRATPTDDELRLETVEEGVFYPDDLEQWNPDGFEVLRELERQRPRSWADSADLDVARTLRVLPLTSFLESRVWRAAYELRAGLVCFNFPFDISRLAWRVGQTRTKKGRRTPDPFQGAFSFALWGREAQDRPRLFRPRVAVKSLDSKRALKAFRSPALVDEQDLVVDEKTGEKQVFRGEFLDVRTLVFALTDRGHTLESACDAFGVPYTKRDVEHGKITREYVEYCREDVEATTRLCEATAGEFLKHPIALPATRAFSPATIGKSYLKAMGIRAPFKRQQFDPRVIGWAMSAYYGGRAECRIRRAPVPVAYCDFLSMYPTVCALMNLWQFLITDHIKVDDDAQSEVQQLLDEITIDDCFNPKRWPQLVGIAQIVPDGDVVPVRARYGDTLAWQIGLNQLETDEPLWYTIADLIASKLLTGKAPRVQRAIRFTASAATAEGLRSVELLGSTPIDPTERDFFQAVVEERRLVEARVDLPAEERAWRSKGLKVLANSTSYGIYAQMIRHELGGDRRQKVTVYGRDDEPHAFLVPSPEDPGEFTFPPIAAAITGGARLLLAMLDRLVTDAGGSYAFCDTDSMAIVATETGGSVACPGGSDHTPQGDEAIRALSWGQVDDIRNRFEALTPYNPDIVKDDLLELEDENFDENGNRRELWCFGISAKRYVLYNRDISGSPELHGWPEFDGETDTGDAQRPPAELLKPSEHGLGHLLNPTDPESSARDWIREAWHLLLEADDDLPPGGPSWLEHPAVAQSSVSSPILRKLFEAVNDGKPYGDQIKPFNFMLTAFVPRQERPADDQRMVLVAPYERDPSKWLEMPWWNRYSGREYRLSDKPFVGYVRPQIHPRTYRDVLNGYLKNPEAKSDDADGAPCEPNTRGLLSRRRVRVKTITHIGKESNRLEDAQTGLIEDVDEIVNEYDDYYNRVFVPLVLPVLRELGVRETHRRTGHSLGAVSAVLAQENPSRPRQRQLRAYVAVAAAYARERLAASGEIGAGEDPFAVLSRYAELGTP